MSASLHSWPTRLSLVAVVALGAGALTLLPGAAPPAAAEGLVPWDDCDTLVSHYRRELERGVGVYGMGGGVLEDFASSGAGATAEQAAPVAAAPQAARSTGDSADTAGALGAVGGGPTGTNIQERGVDEPDTVKAVENLLFVASGGRLQILRAGAEPQLLSSVALGDPAPAELLVEGDRVLALVSGWRFPSPVPGVPVPGVPEPLPVEPDVIPLLPDDAPDLIAPRSMPGALVASSPILPAPGNGFVSAVLVDVADPSAPRVLETLELTGRYVSARLVDGSVRLVTSSTPQVPVAFPAEPWSPEKEQAALDENREAVRNLSAAQVLPSAVHRDASGAVLQEGPAVDCAAVRHPASGPQGSSTLLVTTLRPSQGLAALDSTAVTTDGDLVYASLDRLYVATSRWGSPMGPARGMPDGEPSTELHAFDTSAAERTRYLGTGSVRGYVYGRWALSSHEGHLRVATTLQPPWDGGQVSSSSIAVLAEQEDGLVEVGRVDGLGPDEQIYAVRYFGDLATVVTFRQTDPLYVVDLADPTAPRVLGELKIPGFSTYLHPVGGDRLLGIGQDADPTGRVTGFQVSLFDLSDLSNPVQVSRLSLGPGWSPASEDSRAVSYDPSRSLLAIPFGDERGRQSALGVRVEGDRLVEAGRLTIGVEPVERTLLHDGHVVAVTPGRVVVADAGSWERTGAAALAG